MITVREITTDEGFAGLKSDWDGLFADCTYPSVFCSWAWALEWWRNFGMGDSLCFQLLILAAYNAEGCLIGLAPFYYPAAGQPILGLRPLRPLGTRIRCTQDDMTEEPIILLRQGSEEAALKAIAASLLRRTLSVDLVQMRLMHSPNSPELVSSLRKPSHGAPYLLMRNRQRYAQTITLPKTWAAFRNGLSRSMKDNLPYYPRLLTREGHDWQVRVVQNPDEMNAAVQTLSELHQLRALSSRGPAHTNHLPTWKQQQFFISVMTRLAAEGKASVLLLEIDGQTIAAQSVLEYAGILTFYYSGFDPDWHRYSPLLILNTQAIQSALERGFKSVNYLPEPEPWKMRWGAESTFVLDEFSYLSLHPRAILRSAWRSILRRMGSSCDCGFCQLPE